MKTLLIQPPTPQKSIGYDKLIMDEPLALEYLGADIAPVSEVKILDMRVDSDFIAEVEYFQPDVVRITGFNRLHHRLLLRLNNLYKEYPFSYSK